MTPIDQLKSVLCDSEGKCCITGSDEDRAIIDRALEALEAQRKTLTLNWEPIQEFWRNNSGIDWDELENAINAAAHGIKEAYGD